MYARIRRFTCCPGSQPASSSCLRRNDRWTWSGWGNLSIFGLWALRTKRTVTFSVLTHRDASDASSLQLLTLPQYLGSEIWAWWSVLGWSPCTPRASIWGRPVPPLSSLLWIRIPQARHSLPSAHSLILQYCSIDPPLPFEIFNFSITIPYCLACTSRFPALRHSLVLCASPESSKLYLQTVQLILQLLIFASQLRVMGLKIVDDQFCLFWVGEAVP